MATYPQLYPSDAWRKNASQARRIPNSSVESAVERTTEKQSRPATTVKDANDKSPSNMPRSGSFQPPNSVSDWRLSEATSRNSSRCRSGSDAGKNKRRHSNSRSTKHSSRAVHRTEFSQPHISSRLAAKSLSPLRSSGKVDPPRPISRQPALKHDSPSPEQEGALSYPVCVVKETDTSGVILGYRLEVTRNVAAGEILLREGPIMMGGLGFEQLWRRFWSLTASEIDFLGSLTANCFALSQIAETQIDQLLTRKIETLNIKPSDTSALRQGFRWFVAIVKCNGHGVTGAQNLWGIYESGVRANHSCFPNAIYRNDNGMLYYVASRDIPEGEQVLMAYIDGLYGSTVSRRERILKSKLFVCECSRCEEEVDKSRKIFCPHCKAENTLEQTDEASTAVYVGSGAFLKDNVRFQMTRKMHQSKQPSQTEESWWYCKKCQMTYTDSVMPLAVEGTLVAMFEKLDSEFALPNTEKWASNLEFLQKTSLSVLGPQHWISVGCYYLKSRFYTGLWNGGTRHPDIARLALQFGSQFLAYVEATSPEASFTDAVPFSSVLLRLALSSSEIGAFSALCSAYLDKISLMYGSSDNTVRAYSSALEYVNSYLKDMYQNKNPQLDVKWLEDISLASRRSGFNYAGSAGQVSVPPELKKLLTPADMASINLAPQETVGSYPIWWKACSESEYPWELAKKLPVPMAFLRLAQAALRAQGSGCTSGGDSEKPEPNSEAARDASLENASRKLQKAESKRFELERTVREQTANVMKESGGQMQTADMEEIIMRVMERMRKRKRKGSKSSRTEGKNSSSDIKNDQLSNNIHSARSPSRSELKSDYLISSFRPHVVRSGVVGLHKSLSSESTNTEKTGPLAVTSISAGPTNLGHTKLGNLVNDTKTSAAYYYTSSSTVKNNEQINRSYIPPVDRRPVSVAAQYSATNPSPGFKLPWVTNKEAPRPRSPLLPPRQSPSLV